MACNFTRHPHNAAWAASCPAGFSFGLTPALSRLDPMAALPSAQQHTALRVVLPSDNFTSAASNSQAVSFDVVAQTAALESKRLARMT